VSSSRSRKDLAKATAILVVATLAPVSRAMAQHANDNPVLSAEDAFGLSLGLESIGLYNPFSIRGFNPQAAGNIMIDGLYFDQQGQLSNRVIEGSTIRVGISEIGYVFPAPTGIADYQLRRATDDKLTASIIAQGGPYDEKSISVDGSIPLYSKELQLPLGVNFQTGTPTQNGNLGYTANVVNLGAAPQWRPNDWLTVRAFADWTNITQARTMPTVFTAGDFLPPRIVRGFLGQYWALGHFISENFGGLLHARLSPDWSLAAGLFRSVANNPISYADLFVNTLPNGLGDHQIVAAPDQRTVSTSGEVRLTGHFAHGPWDQKVSAMVRGRDTPAKYGGDDTVDLGTAYIGAPPQVREPAFSYSAVTSELTKLWSTGLAYQVQRTGWGLIALGVQKEHYDKSVVTPGVSESHLTDDPTRLYEQLAVPLPGRALLYSGYTQGFEDSGAAPSTAANRGAILPTTRTWQVDGGVRYPITSKLSLIAGLFELNRPYFNFDTDNVDRQLGVQRASGLELSLAGEIVTGLSINAGALIGHVAVIGPDLAALGVGSAAVGQPSNQEQINLDYALPKLSGLSVDLAGGHFSAAPATVDDGVSIPQVFFISFGERYKFKLLGAPAMLRVQLQNMSNAYIWNIGYSPGFLQFSPRTVFAYLTVDL
jgi:iron complex outermembrane recepter protein